MTDSKREPALALSLSGPVAGGAVALRLFARLFPERALDLTKVASDRTTGDRQVIWLGAEGTGLRIEREWYVQQTRDDEIQACRDLAHEAGASGDPRWFRIAHEFNGIRVEVGVEDRSLAASLRAEIFQAGLGTTETRSLALDEVRALSGLAQDAFGTRPVDLERTRVPFSALDARDDRDRERILARLEAAGAEGSRRAPVVAAVVVARNGALDDALARLDAILAAHPDEPDAAALRALVLVRLAKADPARRDETMRALAALPHQDWRDYLARAVALDELGELGMLLAQLDTPFLGPGLDTHARIAAAVVAERCGDAVGARARAAALVKAQPSIARTFAERGAGPDAQPLLHRLRTFETWRALHAAVTAG
ncbi:MAG: hypothetical protein K1X94_05025 [Sandaracinaceae bacterium]|nr:hypothetical protein [Sandaracinaceae bacterium]